jgi:hypothetical protein
MKKICGCTLHRGAMVDIYVYQNQEFCEWTGPEEMWCNCEKKPGGVLIMKNGINGVHEICGKPVNTLGIQPENFVGPTDPIQSTLDERGKRYGAFCTHAGITQRLKATMRNANSEKWAALTESQKEALEMIAHKIGRILNGDPAYQDSWVDLAGYAQLVVNELEAGK